MKIFRPQEAGSALIYVVMGVAIVGVLVPVYMQFIGDKLKTSTKQGIEEDLRQLRFTTESMFSCKKSLDPLPAGCRQRDADQKPVATPIELRNSDNVVTLSTDETDPKNSLGRYRVLGLCNIKEVDGAWHSVLTIKARCVEGTGVNSKGCADPETGHAMAWIVINQYTDCVIPWKTNNPTMPSVDPNASSPSPTPSPTP